MSAGKLVLGVLVGFAAGAALGILFAPEKGSSLRHKLSQKRDDYIDELENKFNEFVENVTNKIEKVQDDLNDAAENGKHKVDDFSKKFTSTKV